MVERGFQHPANIKLVLNLANHQDWVGFGPMSRKQQRRL